MGFWTSSIVRILNNLEDKNTMFQKLDLFPLGLSKGPNRVGVSPHVRLETDPVSEKSCFYLLNSLQSGRWTKSENPLILCVIHHRQNPIQSTLISPGLSHCYRCTSSLVSPFSPNPCQNCLRLHERCEISNNH
jgi:hypothetical protein